MIDRIFGFTNESEKLAYLEAISENRHKFNSFHYTTPVGERQGLAYDINLAEKSRILQAGENLRKSISFSSDTLVKRKFNEWKQAREDLAFWLSQPVADRDGLDSLYEDKAGMLEKELTRMNVKVNVPYNDRWGQVKNSLKIMEAAIEFATIDYFDGKKWKDSCYYVAWIIKPGNPAPVLFRLFEQRQLNRLLTHSTGSQQITGLYSTRVPGGINPLYKLVWKPIEKELEGTNRVYFSPSGLLHKISFAAIPDEEGRLLSDRFELVQLLTTASVIDTTRDQLQPADKITMYGGIEYNADSLTMTEFNSGMTVDYASAAVLHRGNRDGSAEFGQLAGSKTEVESIRQLNDERYNLSLYTALTATEEKFKSLNGAAAPGVLHLATHGFFFPDPANKKLIHAKGAEVFRQSDNPLMRSGLALAGANNAWKGKPVPGVQDGILTAYEVSNMYMPATKLAVLSACETGLGDIRGSEGVFGLQRAFRMAGVKNLVMSLWKVPDAETAEFMLLFYKGLFDSKTISASFYDAQTAMKNKYRNDPFRWAAWILVR